MRFYSQPQRFYCVDLHARSMHVYIVDHDGQTNSPLKNALVAFFNPRQVRSTARKIGEYSSILTSHPCDDAVC